MYTVVVADDEIELRDAMVATIKWEELGFRVVGEAENGMEALELVEELEPDLLLTDIKMPFVSGIELARRAREIRPAMNIAFLSGHDDFSYAQQAIQYNIISYLLKPISAQELSMELTAIREKMDEKVRQLKSMEEIMDAEEREKEYKTGSFLLSVFLDGTYNKSNDGTDGVREIEKHAMDLGLRSRQEERAAYAVLISEFTNEDGQNKTTAEHVGFVNTILGKYVRHGSAYSNGKILSLVSSTERDVKKYAAIFAKEIIQNAGRIWEYDCVVGVSKEFETLDDGHEAYLEALSACDYAQGSKNEPVFISDMEKVGSYSTEDISDTTTELEHLLKTGEKEQLEHFLADILKSARIANRNFLMIQIVSTIYASACSVAEEEKVEGLLQNMAIHNQLIISTNQGNIEEEILNFAGAAKEMISSQRRMNSEVICGEAFAIIQKEYGNEELTLASLSERLHVSASYLSSLFKKVKGDTFVNLLTKKRMEVAKEQLLCSARKILEIANECGYSDHHYFSYCFKKYYGMSPNKMREQLRGE